MKFSECMRIAIRALLVNAMRSLLTMLGVIIGVGAVITMIAVGSGGQAQIAEQIRSLGANVLIVTPGSQSSGGASLGAGSRQNLTEEDAWAISREIGQLTAVAPAVSGYVQVVHGNRNWRTTVIGAVPAHLVARDWRLASGTEMALEDVDRAAKVAILGATVAEKLFKEQDPVGKIIRIADVPFTVIGLLEDKGQTASSSDQDNIVFVPLSTAKLRVLGASRSTHRNAIDYINIKAVNAAAVDTVELQVKSLLRQRHRLYADAPDDFTVRNISAMFEFQQEASRTLGILLAAVASVSLLVGGISIMNILLVSVAERTREIGIRMAVGAKPRDIRNQFLIEAVVLSVFGGIGGVVCGVTTAVAIAQFAEWPILITPETIVLAVGFAAAVGIFFGFYPALKASRLDPIEALRFE